MNFTFELHDMEPFWTLNCQAKVVFSIIIFLIQGLGIIVHKQLISFLKRKNKRKVNRIIYKNLILQNLIYPPLLCYFLLDIWVQNPSRYIGEYGCYGVFYVGLFIVNHDRAHSLFINLFRYICIVKDKSLKNVNIQPKVSFHPSLQ